MRYLFCAAVMVAILIPNTAHAARHERYILSPEVRSTNIDRPKRPLPPRKRKTHHTKGDFWDVFPIPGLIPAINMLVRG